MVLEQNLVAEEGLWQYALSSYRKSGVESLCLRLQDKHGLDVCILLALGWAVGRGRQCSEALLAQCQQRAARLAEDYIQPLRKMRRLAGVEGCEELYQSLKAAELSAEQWLLRDLSLLIDASQDNGCNFDDVAGEMSAVFADYARRQGVGDWSAPLSALVRALT